jgi:histidinol-phosphate aminotransferase
LPFFSEPAMAQQAERRMMRGRGAIPADAVRISSNENPLGPCKEGLEALYKVAPHGGRYSPFNETGEMAQAIADVDGVKVDYVQPTAGSSDPLMRAACAFTSPTRTWVMANPGYGGGAPEFIGSKTVRVPLRPDHTHDVKAMIKADPNAGAYYVCNPNNPTGTVTSRKDIEYLLANKPQDAVVIVDEAYIHFSDTATSASDLVAADKDVVVLRTFSKAYGMAGIRAGCAIARPDLLAKMAAYGRGRVPITAAACATASLRSNTLVAERRAINKRIRENTLEDLEKRGIQYIASEANFFLMETNRKGIEVGRAFAEHKVIIGRVWDIWPTKVRVSIGTQEEMDKFKMALDKVMS